MHLNYIKLVIQPPIQQYRYTTIQLYNNTAPHTKIKISEPPPIPQAGGGLHAMDGRLGFVSTLNFGK